MSLQLFNILKKQGITPNQYLVLWSCKNGVNCNIIPQIEGELRLLQMSHHLTSENKLTGKGELALGEVESLFRKTKVKADLSVLGDDYLEQIQKYRNKFPTGKRGTPQEVLKKLVTLFSENTDITWDIVHQATDLYLSEVSNTIYTMKAGNFIMKSERDGTTYTLLEYCERVMGGEESVNYGEMTVK